MNSPNNTLQINLKIYFLGLILGVKQRFIKFLRNPLAILILAAKEEVAQI